MPLRLGVAKTEPGTATASDDTKKEEGPQPKRGKPQPVQEVKKEKSKGADKAMTNLQIAIMKAVLRNFQDGSDLQSVCFDIGIGESTLKEIEAGNEEATAYNNETHGKPGHGLGPPHLFLLGGFADSLNTQLLEKTKADPSNAKIRAWSGKLEELVKFLEKATVEEKGRLCTFFKLTKCYKKRGETQKTRITMSFEPSPEAQNTRLTPIQVLKHVSFIDFKVGRPPAGGLEREIQAWLEV